MNKILVIDSNPGIAKYIQKICSKEGFDVVTAETAREGLSLLDKDIILAIFCFEISDMRSAQLLETLKAKSKKLNFMLVSGHDHSFIKKKFPLDEVVFIQKPIIREEFLRKISQIIK